MENNYYFQDKHLDGMVLAKQGMMLFSELLLISSKV